MNADFFPVLLVLLLALPLAAALLLAVAGEEPWADKLNLGVASLNALVALALVIAVDRYATLSALGGLLRLDALNSLFVLITTVVGASTSLYSIPYMRFERQRGQVTGPRLRLYLSMYQGFSLTMLLCLTSDNLGVIWVGMEAATLTTVLLVSLYRTPAAMRAAWKYFILCGVGLALALFGIVLLHMAAEKAGGSLFWSHLFLLRSELDPRIVGLAWVFMLIGYGVKLGLAPLHFWLADAHAEGPTPVSAVLSGLLLNVALYALLRAKMLVLPVAPDSAQLLIVFGLATMVVASLSLYRQLEYKRLFAFSSIEHMGLITLAVGIGGVLTSTLALLHLVGHALIKSSIYFAIGQASQQQGSSLIADAGGLLRQQPLLAWGLMIGCLGIVGMPPLALFPSEFGLIVAVWKHNPWLALGVVLALLLAFACILLRAMAIVFADGKRPWVARPRPLTMMVAMGWHLLLAVLLGLGSGFIGEHWLKPAAQLLSS